MPGYKPQVKTNSGMVDIPIAATYDENGDNIVATYATKAELAAAGQFDPNGTYPNLTAGEATHAQSADNATNANYATSAGSASTATNATHATSADSATKATQDGQGRNIAETYALKSEVGGKLYLQYVQVTLADRGTNIDGYARASIYTSYETPITEEKFCNLNGIPVKLNITGQSAKIGFLSDRSTPRNLYIDVVGEEAKYYRYIGGLTVSVKEA